MSIAGEPPQIDVPQHQYVEIAEAKAILWDWIGVVRHAELRVIRDNVTLDGTDEQQQAFMLTFSEVQGIATRARAGSSDDMRQAKVEVITALDKGILNNPRFDQFKSWIATSPDPFGVR